MRRLFLSCWMAAALTFTTIVPAAHSAETPPQPRSASATTSAQTTPPETQRRGQDFDLGTIISIIVSVVASIGVSLIGLAPLLNYYLQKHPRFR